MGVYVGNIVVAESKITKIDTMVRKFIIPKIRWDNANGKLTVHSKLLKETAELQKVNTKGNVLEGSG